MRLYQLAASAVFCLLPSLGFSDSTSVKSVLSADDPYGVSAPKKDTVAKIDSTKPEAVSATPDSIAPKKARPKLVRETTVNSLNDVQGRYRSPKQALFMSLVIPGLGQAYVGQSGFTYARAVTYLGTDIALGLLWHQYVVVKHDRQVKNYRTFADRNWSQKKYEDQIAGRSETKEAFDKRNPFRESYCDAVQSDLDATGNALNKGCKDPKSSLSQIQYSSFRSSIKDFSGLSDSSAAADSTHHVRMAFPNAFYFYELIGKEQEFITGWRDAQIISFDSNTISGTSAMRDQYVAMRSTANRYARMQAYFLGGIIVNHIVSAIDAALTARYHNKALYQTDAWYDRIHLNSGLAFDGLWPRTEIAAALTF